jgi:hypothetical protein
LDATSLVIGPLTVVRGVAWDGSPDWASFLEQQPAKGDGDQCRNEKRQPDASLVVASDGSKL